ncbi:hypothetical protein CP532_1585 [Ophiocordyceps camponoti-leonardi (nom. inval.)]|nr:hypothetical protein CP532_1585 [Ophiocordyceps camponoti-leonardi (nom. inval.)]
MDASSDCPTCLKCLDPYPEHCLPCGHVICSVCLKAVGDSMDGGFFELKQCPLLIERRCKDWSEPWIGVIKPDQAGIRILSLDGGGTRGIVELRILGRIQQQLGPVPLRDFFDLIVGTSSGGIIACGLGPGDMSIEECTTMFEKLSREAFSAWTAQKFATTGEERDWKPGYPENRPLDDACRRAFSENHKLFGGTTKSAPKVAVTAITIMALRDRVTLLGNYNRKPSSSELYKFQRPLPDRALCVWEAARATSASLMTYSFFLHKKGKVRVYLDGGFWNNNPIRIADEESRAIWPETKSRHPDLVLSIGAGYHKAESSMTELGRRASEQMKAEGRFVALSDNPVAEKNIGHLFKQATRHFKINKHDWHEWLRDQLEDGDKDGRRYRRLTVRLPVLVEMDDASQEARDVCHGAVDGMNTSLFAEVADRLIASAFFLQFGAENMVKLPDGGFEVTGNILCRLQPRNISLLGERFDNICKETSDFRPHFWVRERHSKAARIVPIDAAVVNGMKEGRFRIGLKIDVSSAVAETEIVLVLCVNGYAANISAFPRKLLCDYDVDKVKE